MCKRRACRSRPVLLFKFENMKKKFFKMFNKVACLRSLAVMALLAVVSVGAFAQTSVMTFNIRLDASVDGPNVWANRKAAVCEMLHYYSPDLLGLQEVCPNQMDDLKAGLPDYEALGVGRDDGKYMGEHSPVFFKKSRYKLIKHGDFSLSETPEVFGTKGWDASYNRVCSWAILKDLKSGKKIAFFNTHLDNDGQVARREGIRLILNRMKEYAPGLPAIITADYTAHGMGDLKTVSALALNAGTDMDMVADGFLGTLAQSLADGSVKMEAIDTACRRILETKWKLGLFADPYRYCNVKRAKKEIFTPANREEARRVAAETFVLLKNNDNLLPLKKTGRIALVGPLANTASNMSGTWSVAARLTENKTVVEAMREALAGKAEVVYAKGSNLMYDAQREADATMFGRDMRDPRSAKEMLDEAVAVAKDADVIVAAVGEASEMSGECSSRSNLDMPDAQRDMLLELKKLGKPIVLLYFSGRPTVMTWENETFPAILNVWFGGCESANAICDVLFGDKAPSGKLSATMPKNVGQIPLFYNHLNTGRPLAEGRWFEKFHSTYLDVDNDPLFPFGYGLSYTTFSYGKPSLSSTTLSEGGKLTLSVDVTNTGSYDADEVVQLYVRDLVGSVSRPVKELKGFKRISLKKGEKQTVSFDITPDDLKFYNQELECKWEPGDFDIMVGPNSRDVQTLRFTLK